MVPQQCKGIASITRTGAGAYDIVLQDSYYRFLAAVPTFLAAAPSDAFMWVVSEDVDDNSSPVVSVQFADAAGNPTDPGVGDEIYMQFSMSNSSAL